jgi:hypothetical protein
MTTFGNLREWRKKEEKGKEFVLPSGLHVRIRYHISILDLAARGVIPLPLLGAAKVVAANGYTPRSFDFEKMPEYTEVLNAVVSAALMYPRVVGEGEEPGDDSIGIEELSIKERVLIYNEVADLTGELATFRTEPATPENDRGNGKAKREKAVQSIGADG